MATRKVFSQEQMARYRRVFDMCDRNKNGVLEGRELAAMAHVMGYGFSKDQIKVITILCINAKRLTHSTVVFYRFS